MQFIFIDEVESHKKDPDFFGLGAAVFGYYSYHKYKESFVKEFKKLNWNPRIEFKGKYLFSMAGDKEVPVEKRINFVESVARETCAKSNSRLIYLFSKNRNGSNEENYLDLLKKIIIKIKPKGSGFKKLVAYFLDNNEMIDRNKIIDLIENNKNCLTFERPFFIDSDNHVPGIITIDILNYLKSWVELNPTESEQLTLFDKIAQRDAEKMKTVKSIIGKIKIIKDIK